MHPAWTLPLVILEAYKKNRCFFEALGTFLPSEKRFQTQKNTGFFLSPLGITYLFYPLQIPRSVHIS